MDSISLCGFYGKHNMGDDLMQDYLAGILHQGKPKNLTVFSDCNGGTAINGLKSDRYLNADTVVIGGGGIVEPNFWAFRDGGLDALINSGKKVTFLNVSVYEGFADNQFQEKLRDLDAQWIVRDAKSAKVLSDISINSEVIPDVAFSNFEASGSETIENSLLFYPNYYPFSKAFGRDNSLEDYLRYLSFTLNMSKFLDWMASFGWKITIMPAQTDRAVDDRLVGAAIYSHVQKKESIQWRNYPSHYAEHEAEISRAQLIISMRYHSSVMAIKYQIPCIDIIHHNKNMGLWEDVDLSGNLVEHSSVRTGIDSLIQAAEYLKHNDREYKSRTESYAKKGFLAWSILEEKLKNKISETQTQTSQA